MQNDYQKCMSCDATEIKSTCQRCSSRYCEKCTQYLYLNGSSCKECTWCHICVEKKEGRRLYYATFKCTHGLTLYCDKCGPGSACSKAGHIEAYQNPLRGCYMCALDGPRKCQTCSAAFCDACLSKCAELASMSEWPKTCMRCNCPCCRPAALAQAESAKPC
jgi:hypothetical protein